MTHLYELEDIVLLPTQLNNGHPGDKIEFRVKDAADLTGMAVSFPIFTSPMESIVRGMNVEVFARQGIKPVLPGSESIDIRMKWCEYVFCAFSLQEVHNIFLQHPLQSQNQFHICIDAGNGHDKEIFSTAQALRRTYGNQVLLMGGNVGLPEVYKDYSLGHTPEKLLSVIQTHTTNTVKSINSTGQLRWVQIGNEVDEGFLWNDGRETANFVTYINTAYDAVKAVNPEVQTVIHVSECENTQWLTDYFDTLQVAGAKWDAIGLSVHIKHSALTPEALIAKVAENVKTLKERYGKPVLVVETGYYNDRPVEANQWLCDFLQQLLAAGASGLYYWEPELADDFDLGAINPLTRKVSIALDAFLGVRHTEGSAVAVSNPMVVGGETTEYFTTGGVRIAHPQRGLNIIRQKTANGVKTYHYCPVKVD